MNCPRCGFSIDDALTMTCPHCGQSLVATVAEDLPDSGAAADAIYETPALPASGPTPPDSSGDSAPLPAPPRKRKTGLIIGILIALAVILASALGVSLYALAHNQQSASMPAPTATPNATILYQNSFTLNATEWLSDSHCFFQNGAYHIKDGYICFAPAGVIPEGNISVDAQQVAGPNNWLYGLVFRHTSQGDYYQFGIDSHGDWYFGKVVNNTGTALLGWIPNPAIKAGLNTVNTLLVHIKGAHFDFYINGTKVGEADDTTFSAGLCGIRGGPPIEAAFNNFEITTAS